MKVQPNLLASLLLLSTVTSCIAFAEPRSTKDSIRSLVDYQITVNGIPQPLTTTPGDRGRGLAAFLDRTRGHCLLCHSVTSLTNTSQGNIGPRLDNIGDRLNKAALRLRIVDGTVLNPDTAMPPYYRTRALQQVSAPYQNKPVLTAQEVEDIVEWLSSLGTANAN